MMTVEGQIVDILNEEIYFGSVTIEDDKIISVRRIAPESIKQFEQQEAPYILPGFIDAHVHIESSMLIPSEFARLSVAHGTVATVSDPHEIANVCGLAGVEFMIENAAKTPFKFFFGAPSCVPATPFETAGASLNSNQVESLLHKKEIYYLSEMMNFPGVLNKEDEVMKKIEAAKRAGKPVDGHAPGLMGQKAREYVEAGISTDHECFTREEAAEKLQYGMKIIIREGSAAKNFEALIGLLEDHADNIMFCSDDKHPDSLVNGHINQLCSRAAAKNISVFKVLRAACINPIMHYGLGVGMLQENDPADFIMVKDLKTFEIIRTYINGILVAENGKSLIKSSPQTAINQFNCSQKKVEDFEVRLPENAFYQLPVIEAIDGQLITNKMSLSPKGLNGKAESNLEQDILKIVVVNRYREMPVAKAFVKNFGFTWGAIASSVAHDSHNIVAVGVEDERICEAVNLIISCAGGVSCCGKGGETMILPLPVAGLMSLDDGYAVARAYTAIDAMAKSCGTKLSAPFMTLSFMALLVIPHLKLSDQGLFDGDGFLIMHP